MSIAELENEGKGIPFHLVRELLEFLPYATKMSIAIKLLCFTGCRIAEVQHMKRTNIYESVLYWHCGKNQHGQMRKEYLPPEFIAEIDEFRRYNRVKGDYLLSLEPKTISRYFNDMVRPHLSKAWQTKRVLLTKNNVSKQFMYQLKGLRKNFATLLFAHYWQKFDDSSVAVEMVSKRMKHSCREITAHHYIETLGQIDAMKFAHLLPFQIATNVNQRRIGDYLTA